MAKSRVVDIDKGWNRIVAELNELNDNDVFVGIHSGAQSTDETGELTAAAIGAIHEFGTKDGRIPQRSWLRAGTDHFSREFGEKYSEIFKDVTKGRGTSAKRGLNRLGLFAQAKVREYIRRIGQNEWPDISDATKLKKGSTRILIDTGQFVNGVTYTVRPASVASVTAETIAATIGGGAARAQSKATPKAKRSLKTIKSERRKGIRDRKKVRKAATRERRKVRKKSAKQAKKRRDYMKKLRTDDRKQFQRDEKKAKRKARRKALTIQKRETRKRNSAIKRERRKARKKALNIQKRETRKRNTVKKRASKKASAAKARARAKLKKPTGKRAKK